MKRSGKRLLAVLLCLAMAMTLLPVSALARWDDDAIPAIPAEQDGKSAVKAELPMSAGGDDVSAGLSAGNVYPDAAKEAWAQHSVTVKGTDSICENATESTSGHLRLKASASNGKDGGSNATGWPAVFMSSTMNSALQVNEDGNYTVSFKMKFNVVDAFGVFINYTDPSKGFFLGYNNGAWYSQRYGVGGTNWTNHESATPVAGTVYKVELSWNATNHTASFKMQTEDGQTVLSNMTSDSYADLIAVDGIETVNNFALVVGKYSAPAEIEAWDIHYSGQATVPAYSVSGKVSDENGVGLADVEVTTGSYTATTEANGTYTLELPSGAYTLTAKKDGYITATKDVTVGSAGLTGQNMTMEVSHTVDIPVDAAEDITNWTKLQGTGAAEPTLNDGRLILMAGTNNHEKLTAGSAAIYTNSTMENELRAVDGKKWISFKLTPTSIKSNDSFAEDYLGFGITLNYNGQTGANAKGYYIGFCTHSGTNNTSEEGVNHDGFFWQEWNADGTPWNNFTLPDGLKSGQEMKFYIEWTDTTILLKINDKEIPLGTNQMTATGDNITNKIAFSMGGGNTFKDDKLQSVTIQTQLTLWDIHYSGQETEKGHTVAGTVKDDHNKALSGAVVSTGNGKYTATTDTNGKYNMILPEAESAYTVTAELDGYTTATKQVTVNEDSNYQVLEATDFTLPLLPVIKGKVVDTKGNGIFGATVSSDKRPKDAYATTDADGNFTVIGAVTGEHTLTVSAEGYETTTKTVTVDGQNVTGVEIELEDRQIPSYTLSTDDMDVKVAQGFPQVIQYTMKGDLAGKTMYGQTAELDTIKINGKDVKLTDKVTSVLSDDNKKVTYTMVIDETNNGTTGVTATITAEIRVGLEDINEKDSEAAGRTLGFYITGVEYANSSRLAHPVDTIEIPNHSLVSVRSTEPGAAVTGAKLASNTVTSSDVTYKAAEYLGSTWGGNFFTAFVYNDQLSAGLASNSAYGTASAGSDTYPVRAQFEAKDGGVSLSIGLGSTLWYYDRDITQDEGGSMKKLTTDQLPKDKQIIAPLETPYAKVVITGEMNGNGKVDWQDGAIAYRETVMHIPVGGEQVANTANLRISMNFGSMATNPFLIALDNVKRVSAHTDGLGQFVLLKGYAGEGHDSNHPQYDNIGIRMGGPDDFKTLLEEGEKLGAAFGIHTNASEFYAEAITNADQVLRYSNGGMKYGWNWLDQGISINAVYDYASGLRKARWDALYEIVKGHPFTVYVDVWGNNTSGTEDAFLTRALSNEILKDHDGWRIAHEWAWANPYESTFQHWTTDYTYGNYSDKGKLNSSVIRFVLNQYKDSFPADFATFGGACNAPLLGGPAMQGFEGWQGDGEYNLSIYNTFNQMIYTKFLQHYSVTEWTDASKAVKMVYSQGANGERSNETDWTPEVQVKLAGGGDEIVVTRGTTGKIMTDATLAKMSTASGFLANETEYRSRVVTLNGKVIVTGAPASAGEDNAFPSSKSTLKYLIPWYWKVDGERVAAADEKLYHWNAQGGQSTWELPDGWENLGTVILYELSDQGRDAGKTVRVIDGKVTLTATANTCYVVTKGADADNAPNIKYGTGLHLEDPSFNIDTPKGPWKISGKGSAVHTTNKDGIGVLKMTGEVSISQVMTDLEAGTNYVSYVAVDNRSNAKAKMTITDKDGNVVVTNYTERSIAKNYVSSYYLHNGHGMEAGGSYFQNMFVYFTPTAEGLPYTMTLSREAGAGNVYFDDLRTVEYGFNYARSDGSTFGGGQTAQSEKGSATIPVEYDPETGAAIELHQDFENVPQGIWPFVVGPVEGVADNRSHVSELNAPFTQAGWDVKKLDDVIDGNWSIKINGLCGRNNLVYQTIPQNFRFEANKVYTVSFDYELGTAGSYLAVVGDGAYTGLDGLTVYNLEQTLNTATTSAEYAAKTTTAKATVGHIEFTVVGSESGQTWIGIYSKNDSNNQGTSGDVAAFGGYKDFVLDNLHIEAAPADKQELAKLLQQADAMTDSSIYTAVTGTDEAAWTAMTTARTSGHTVFDTENVTTEQVTAAVDALTTAIGNLVKVEVSISGTVTNANNKPVAGVILTLENATYFPTGLTVTTGEDGTFKFESKSGVELVPGTYHIKAQCTGYNVTTTGDIVVTKADAAKTQNISLVAEAPGAYVNDFNQCLDGGSENIGYGSMGNLLNEDELESLNELTKDQFDALTDSEKAAYLKTTVLPTMQWIEYNGSGALKVTWHCNDNGSLGDSRYINNVLDKTIAFKNGSASYDVTALTTGVRFSVAMRASETKKLVTVGQQDSPKNWMGEFWNTDGSGCSSTMTTNVLAVEPGVTRNIRIDANDTTFTVYVDGIQAYQTTLGDSSYYYVYSWTGAEATPLVDPGYIGINMRYGAGSEFIIDNIHISSADTVEGVHNVSGTVTTQGGDAISGAAIDLYQGDTRVAGTSTNALGAYQVTGVEPGTYTVKVSAPFFTEKTGTITVGSADLTGKNFTLTLDKSSLTNLIAEVKALNGEDYTAETWETLAEELAKAETVAGSDSATVAALNTAYRDLGNAKEALEAKPQAAADFSELRDLYNEMANVDNDNYTNATWAAFQDALDKAYKIQLAGTATQKEIDAAKDALQAAYDGLEQATPVDEMNFDALQAAYDAAKDVAKGNASDANWEKFVDARDAALAILSNADGLTQDDVDAATKALTDAQSALRKSATRPSTSTTTTEVKEDGTKVTTETKPDGTKVETVEEPDGTKAVTETKPDGSKTATVEQPDGTTSETVVTPEGDATITVTDADGEELVKTEIPATIPEPEDKFEDIDQTPWAEEAINNMAGLKLVNGIGGNKYDPTTPMTRGALATVLHRLSNGKTDYKAAFKDVQANRYYTEGVAWAAKAKVVTGYTTEIFAPDDIITREQLAVMMVRYAKLIGMDTKADAKSLDTFVDGEDTGAWAVDGVAWCVEKGILKGKGLNNLDPTANVSRAEVAVMLDRFIALIQK